MVRVFTWRSASWTFSERLLTLMAAVSSLCLLSGIESPATRAWASLIPRLLGGTYLPEA